MESVAIISRSDDLGSSISANIAIEQVINAGFIKNVSIMACGPAIEDAARRLAHRTDVCFGLHVCLNAEWDRVKWKPLSPQAPDSGLTDENGFFLSDPGLFRESRPSVEAILTEVTAQYERLRSLGFAIRYLDSHMFYERYVPGVDEAIAAFAIAHGLLDHMYYYRFLPERTDWLGGAEALRQVPAGQYLLITHPSLDTEEMRRTGNRRTPGDTVARRRARETAVLSDPDFLRGMAEAGIAALRYDQAVFDRRMTVPELTAALG